MLRRKYILLLGLLMFGIPKLTHAQVNFVTGSLTAQAAACPTSPGPSSSSTSALTISTVGYGGATFTLGSSAFSATVSFYGSGDGGTTWQPLNAVASNATSAVLLATATGVFQTNVSGYTNVCMVVTTFVSGTVTARIQLSTISARAGGGVSGGGLPAGCTGSTGTITCATSLIAGTVTSNHVTLNGADGSSKCFQSDGATLCIPSLIGGKGSVAGAGVGFEGWSPNTDDLMHWYIDGVDNGTQPVYLTGIAGTDTYTSTSPIAALAKGQQYCFDPINTRTAAVPTLNINSLGAKSILQPSSLIGGHITCFVYNGAAFDPAVSSPGGILYFRATDYGVLADVQVNFAPSWSSGSNIVTCSTCNFTGTDALGRPIAKVGQIIFGSNVNPLGAAANGTAVVQLPQTTIQSIDSATQIHTVGNANANWTIGPLIWGDDDSTALANAWTAAANACGILMLPAGRMFTQQAQFITAPTTQCSNNVGTARFGPAVTGAGMGATTIIPTPNFNATTCTGNTNACFFSYAVPFAGGMIAKDFTIWGGGNSAIGAGFNGKWLVDFGANTAAQNFTISAWGGNTSGTTGLHVSSFPVTLYDVESDGAGAQTCQVSDATTVPAVVFNGVYCGDSNGTGGVAALEINGGALTSSNSFYFNMPGNSCDVEEDGGGVFQSSGDVIGANTNANTLGLCVASTGIAYIVNDRVQGNTAVDLLGSGTLHASQTIFTGNTTAILNASGTSFFDDGGNTFTGTTKFTQSAGALYGSASITGVTQTSGNWSVPAGSGAGQWGTTPTVACPGTLEGSAGSSTVEACTITVGSGTVGANPVLTITWPVPFLIPPNCSAKMTGGTAALANFTSGVPTLTTGTFTYQGTPGASTTIGLVVNCGNG